MTGSKRVILIAALIAVCSLVLAPTAALAAGSRIVDAGYPSPAACRRAGYATIQAAVDSFAPGQNGAITVCAGTYTENVSITGLGKIKIIGRPGAVLTTATGNPLITATGTKQLTVQGLTLDGAAISPTPSMIYALDTNAVITKNRFQNAADSFGVRGSVNGSGRHTLKVTGNTLTGVGGVAFGLAGGGPLAMQVSGNQQTGGQIGVEAVAITTAFSPITIASNKFQGSGTYYGIWLNGMDKTLIAKNLIDNFQLGIYLLANGSGAEVKSNQVLNSVYGMSVASTSNALISGNNVQSTNWGILVTGSALDANSNWIRNNRILAGANGFTGIAVNAAGGPSANLNRITGNTVSDALNAFTGTIGIHLENTSGMMDGTLLKNNQLINMDTPYAHSGDSNTTIGGNTCTPASPCVTP